MPTNEQSIEPTPAPRSAVAPREFADMPPVNPSDRERRIQGGWKGSAGLAADILYYGRWLRDEAFGRIGHLYPKVRRSPEGGVKQPECGGEKNEAVAWLWARTVKCPNPGCGSHVPLATSYLLSTSPGSLAWVEPVAGERGRGISFDVVVEESPTSQSKGTSAGATSLPSDHLVSWARYRCLVCGLGVASAEYVRQEVSEGRAGFAPLAVVADGPTGWTLAGFGVEQSAAIRLADRWLAEQGDDAGLSDSLSDTQSGTRGLRPWVGQRSPRQAAALATFSDLVRHARPYVVHDMIDHYSTGSSSAYATIERDTTGYASAVVGRLALVLDACADHWSTSLVWEPTQRAMERLPYGQLGSTSRILAEVNPFGEAPGSWASQLRAAAGDIWPLSS